MREGSAARNLEALWPIVREFPQLVMFCTDDAHPDDLLRGHINAIVARCIAHGLDLFDVLRAACVHAVEHYRLPTGLLREGDRAEGATCCRWRICRYLRASTVEQRVSRSKSARPH